MSNRAAAAAAAVAMLAMASFIGDEGVFRKGDEFETTDAKARRYELDDEGEPRPRPLARRLSGVTTPSAGGAVDGPPAPPAPPAGEVEEEQVEDELPLEKRHRAELDALAKELGLDPARYTNKGKLAAAIRERQAELEAAGESA